jgi:uncharacterized phage infection (PIP) family protein YhgE
MANEQNATPAGTTLPNSEQLKADANKLKSQAADIADQARSRATELAEEAKNRGKDQIQTGKQAAADQVEKIADALQHTTEGLQRGDQQTLADYANELATSARNLATNLRERSVEDLLNDAQTLARRNPTIFFLGSVAVGVVLSRFFKASAARSEQSGANFGATEYDRERSWQFAGRQASSTESRVDDLETESASVTEAKGY